MITVYILAVSIALQFAAAFLALRLIRVTGRRLAWILISAALIFMAARRLISFSRVLTGDLSKLDPSAELTALGISILMVAGIAGIAPLFSAVKKSQEESKRSELKYRNLFDNAVEGIFQTTPEARLISVNMAYVRMFGYESPEEAIRMVGGNDQQMFMNPDDRKRAMGILTETGFLKDFEC